MPALRPPTRRFCFLAGKPSQVLIIVTPIWLGQPPDAKGAAGDPSRE
ncbi:hypothetical protein AB0C06_24730 [Micromonospora inaquosa]|nr:hypothetical protein [Micromonospora inaquosa]